MCSSSDEEFPAPAFDDTEMKKGTKDQPDCKLILQEDADKQPPGTLPASSSELSTAARGLLMRLLDRDPRMRMRNLRQLQQSAFFMGFNIEAVKEKKVSPKEILQRCFLDSASHSGEQSSAVFNTFDQPVII